MGSSNSKQKKAMSEKNKMIGPRIWLPLDVLQGEAYANLGLSSKALLIDLAAQLRAKFGVITNNGDLTTALKVLSKSGWKSDKTIRKAAKQLEAAMLIVKTRQGHLPNVANLYAVTWLDLNENSKLDVLAKGFPYKSYLRKETIELNKFNG